MRENQLLNKWFEPTCAEKKVIETETENLTYYILTTYSLQKVIDQILKMKLNKYIMSWCSLIEYVIILFIFLIMLSSFALSRHERMNFHENSVSSMDWFTVHTKVVSQKIRQF